MSSRPLSRQNTRASDISSSVGNPSGRDVRPTRLGFEGGATACGSRVLGSGSGSGSISVRFGSGSMFRKGLAYRFDRVPKPFGKCCAYCCKPLKACSKAGSSGTWSSCFSTALPTFGFSIGFQSRKSHTTMCRPSLNLCAKPFANSSARAFETVSCVHPRSSAMYASGRRYAPAAFECGPVSRYVPSSFP